MKRNGKIIKINSDFVEGSSDMFLIYRRINPAHNQGSENENTKNQSHSRPALMRAIRN